MSARALLLFLVQAPLALLLTAVFAAAACVAALFDRGGHATREVGGVWSRVLLRLLRVDVQVRGAGNVVAGPAIYAANHASALDILVIFGHLPVDFRIVYKRSLSMVPLLGWSIWLGGHVPIDRRSGYRARPALDLAARRLREGRSLVAFPEGTRSPDGTVRRFKRGSFGLALETGVPIVPVSLAGVKAVVPHTMTSLRPGRIVLALAPALHVAGRPAADAEAIAEEVRQIVAANCKALEAES